MSSFSEIDHKKLNFNQDSDGKHFWLMNVVEKGPSLLNSGKFSIFKQVFKVKGLLGVGAFGVVI